MRTDSFLNVYFLLDEFEKIKQYITVFFRLVEKLGNLSQLPPNTELQKRVVLFWRLHRHGDRGIGSEGRLTVTGCSTIRHHDNAAARPWIQQADL